MHYYPRLNSTYMTEKLKEQLSKISQYPMTLLVAPAGYGKSTAITWWDEYRRHYFPDSVSYRINVLSDDLEETWNDFCRMFKKEAPDFAKKMMKIGFPKNGRDMHLLSQIWEGTEEWTEEIYIVIDDAHLIPYYALAPFLLFLADRLPPRFHIILLSRNAVFSSSQRMKLGRSLFQISAECFQLDQQEIAGYAKQCGLPLSEEDTMQLAAFSGGWISLIYLAFCNFAKTGAWQFGNADIDRLITEVMLEPLDKNARELLTACSVVPEFTEELAAYLWQESGVTALLEKLSRENAFIVRDKEGVYRCHNLLLKNTMKEFRMLSGDRQKMIWERLGDWHFEKENYLSAASAYRKAEAWDKLLHTVAVDRNSSFGGPHMMLVHEWCESCPEDKLRKHPDAVLIFALQHFIDGNIPTMLQLNHFMMECVNNDPTLTNQERANYAGESEILLGFLEFNSIDGMSRHHRLACELMDRESVLVNHRSPWTFGSPSILALYHRESGRLNAENESMRECMPHYYELTDHHGNGSELSMLAETELLRGHFENAEIHYFHAVRAAKRKHQYSILITAEFTAIRLALLNGDFKRAMEQLNGLRRQLMDQGEFVILPTLDLCEAWIYALLGQKERIPQTIWAEDLVKTIMAVSAPVVVTVQNEALLTSGAYTQVVSLYEETKEKCERCHMLLCEIYTDIQYAAALSALNRGQEAIEVFRNALDQALPDELYLPFAEHGKLLETVMNTLKAKDAYREPLEKIQALTDRLETAQQKILSEHFGSEADWGLSQREMEIAHLAAKRKTTKEISEELFLSENTVRNHLGHIFNKLGIEGTARNKREKLEAMLPTREK